MRERALFRTCQQIHVIKMADDIDHSDMEDVAANPTDFFDHEPSKTEKVEVRSKKS